MDGIIGSTGFVGQQLLRILPDVTTIGRSDVANRILYPIQVLYIAAPGAMKWQIDAEPLEDLAEVQRLTSYIKQLRPQRVYLFSTIDVFSDRSNCSESSKRIQSPSYGGNRTYFEDSLLNMDTETYVRRLGGLFGPGLKKNLIFDLIHRREDQLLKYNPNSRFQYLSLDSSVRLSLSTLLDGHRIVNIVGEPISAGSIAGKYRNLLSSSAPEVHYDVKTEFHSEPYFQRANEILRDINNFIRGR